MATFHLDSTHLMAVMGDTTLVTSLLAGEYINYRQILPTSLAYARDRETARAARRH